MPWTNKGHWEVYPEGVATQQAISAKIGLQSIRETKARATIYTDGPSTGRATAGGASKVATVEDPSDHVIIHTSKIRGTELTFSYQDHPLSGSRLHKGQLPH